MAKNQTGITDFEEDNPDWIELYNGTDATINLFGYFLSDDFDNKEKWAFPETFIAPQSHLIIFASGKDGYYDGELHSNFSIKAEGEALYLQTPMAIYWILQ